MLTLDITADHIRIARATKTFPVTVAFEKQFYFADVRSNPVCAVLQRKDDSWLKIRFPFRMWDWGMTFIQGGTPEPTVLKWPGHVMYEESILVDPYVKDMRAAEYMVVPVTEAE